MDPQTVVQAVDHAARQSDRWLFVAMLVVFVVAMALLVRWLAAQYNRLLDGWREDMKAMQAEMKSLHSERLAAADRHSDELRSITKMQAEDAKAMLRSFADVMAKNAETMGSVQRALNDLQQSCAIARAGWPVARHGPTGGPTNPPSALS